MKLFSLIFLILFITPQLWSYEDSDIDGVDDKNDLCPDTPFDKLVDIDGCPENRMFKGRLTIQLGSDTSIDEENNYINNYNFFGNYSYKMWSFSLSNSQQTTYDNNNNPSISGGDLYLNFGYQFHNKDVHTNLNFGTKIATANESIGTGENDYFSSLNISYLLNENFILLSHISYTLNGDSSKINYQNSLAYSFGTGYILTPNWYTSLSYDYTQSIYRDSSNYQSFSWLNSYNFLEDYFVSLNYTYGVDGLSYPHTFSFKLGVTFE